MADIYSKDGEFDFQKDIFTLNNERVASEKEIAIRNKVKAIAGVAFTITTKPKIVTLDTYGQKNLPKVKLFSDLINDVIVGVLETSASLNDEIFLISRGIVEDSTLIGTPGDSVYVNNIGEMTLSHSNCKIGILLKNGIVLVNIGVESSNNDLSLKYDFLTSRDLPTAFRKLTYPKGFHEINVPAGEESLQYVDLAYSQPNNITIAVSPEGTKRIMRSLDCGLTWTTITAPAMISWSTVAYGNGTFVALSGNGMQRCMTSPDGINWTLHTVGLCAWKKITFGNGIFVAVASSGVKRLMTSTDGVNWTEFAVPTHSWRDVAYNPISNMWVAAAYNGNFYIGSINNGMTWTVLSPIYSGALSPGPLYPLTLTAVKNGFIITSPTVLGYSDLPFANLNVNGTITNGSTFVEYNFATNYIARNLSGTQVVFGEYPGELPDYGFTVPNPICCIGSTEDGAFIIFTSGLNNKIYRTYKL